jgi:uncharacterized membrane protein
MNALMLIHIAGGTIALASGAGALMLRKGSELHAQTGNIFVGSMVVMGATASILSPLKEVPDRNTLIGGVFVCYLVFTSCRTVRRGRAPATLVEVASCAVALACAGSFAFLGYLALSSFTGRFDGYGPGILFGNAALAALAAALDLNFVIRRTLNGVQRLSRHLWRMCVALTMASGAFFLGQQDVMPSAFKGSFFLFVPAVAPLAFLIFWLTKLRLPKLVMRAASQSGFPMPGTVIVGEERA